MVVVIENSLRMLKVAGSFKNYIIIFFIQNVRSFKFSQFEKCVKIREIHFMFDNSGVCLMKLFVLCFRDCYETPANMNIDNRYGFQDDSVDNSRLSTVSYPQLGPPPPYPANPMRRPPPLSVCCPARMPAHRPSTVQDNVDAIDTVQRSQIPI